MFGNKRTTDNIQKACDKAKEMLKKNDGLFFICAIPNMTNEQFEKWQLGEPVKILDVMCGSCTGKEAVVFLNVLVGKRQDLIKKHPEALMGEMLSQMKRKMIIDEEDLKK